MSHLMEIVQTVCACTFIAGVIRYCFPKGEMKPVISTVLAIYILASVMEKYENATPTFSLPQNEWFYASDALDFDDYALQLFNEAYQTDQEGDA